MLDYFFSSLSLISHITTPRSAPNLASVSHNILQLEMAAGGVLLLTANASLTALRPLQLLTELATGLALLLIRVDS